MLSRVLLGFVLLTGCSADEHESLVAVDTGVADSTSDGTSDTVIDASCRSDLVEGAACTGNCQLLATCNCAPATGYSAVCCVRGHVTRPLPRCVDPGGPAGPSCGCTPDPYVPDASSETDADAASD